MDSFARVTLLALPTPMQAVSNHFGKTADVHRPVEFNIDGKISLDISEDGVNSRGWTIIPATNPVVRTCVLEEGLSFVYLSQHY